MCTSICFLDDETFMHATNVSNDDYFSQEYATRLQRIKTSTKKSLMIMIIPPSTMSLVTRRGRKLSDMFDVHVHFNLLGQEVCLRQHTFGCMISNFN